MRVETPAIPRFVYWKTATPQFVEDSPFPTDSPIDPRAQLGWLDERIDRVKGVLKQLEAWRLEVAMEQEPCIGHCVHHR